MDTHAGLAKFIPCGRPMRWDATVELWQCASHGKRSVDVDQIAG